MTPRLIFAHGWALDRSLWSGVLDELGPLAADAVTLDAGYYGAPQDAGALDERPLLGVGQSLGVLELLCQPPAPLAGLVALDGFARFCAGDDFAAGQDARKLRLMARRLDSDPHALTAEFIGRALDGAELPSGEPNRAALARGLERLVRLDGRAAAARLPVWRLHAENDPIAPLALADASFAQADVRLRQVREGHDHLSPLTAPHACAALIRQAAQVIAGEAAA